MALPNVNINIGQGGLGRPLPGKDHFSSILFYTPNGTTTLPTGFGTDRIKQVFSLKEAEDLGIVSTNVVFAVLQYHVAEFFRIQPLGVLFIGIFEQLLSPNYLEIDLIQKEADGQIRQMGIYETIALANASIDLIQGVVTTLRTADKQPMSVLYGANIFAVATVATLADLRTLSDSSVSVVIGQDGSGVGAALFVTNGESITTLGTSLGAVALASVSESIAHVENFNLQIGNEYDIVVFANGESVKEKSQSFLNTLNDKGYIFLRKFTESDFAGSFHNDSHTAIAASNDLATIENNRTIDKASRLILGGLLPRLNSPLVVDPITGRLSEATIAIFKNDTELALETMLVNAEVSGLEVIIDPEQNVLTTSQIDITVNIVPVGVARQINFTIGFTLQLS